MNYQLPVRNFRRDIETFKDATVRQMSQRATGKGALAIKRGIKKTAPRGYSKSLHKSVKTKRWSAQVRRQRRMAGTNVGLLWEPTGPGPTRTMKWPALYGMFLEFGTVKQTKRKRLHVRRKKAPSADQWRITPRHWFKKGLDNSAAAAVVAMRRSLQADLRKYKARQVTAYMGLGPHV